MHQQRQRVAWTLEPRAAGKSRFSVDVKSGGLQEHNGDSPSASAAASSDRSTTSLAPSWVAPGKQLHWHSESRRAN